MSNEPIEFQTLQRLLTGLLDEQLDDEDRRRLIDLLRNDPVARTYYLETMLTDAMLRLEHDAKRACKMESSTIGPAENATVTSPISGSSTIPHIVVNAALPSSIAYHSSFIGSAVFSYVIAAAIVGIGLVLAAITQTSQPGQFSQLPDPGSASHLLGDESKRQRIGCITNIADCVWETHGLGVGDWRLNNSVKGTPVPVRLGDRFNIRAGLLEITYDTGAKVILQGPVTYEVDSSAGGYLAIGKLTANLADRHEGRGERIGQQTTNRTSEIRNPTASRPITHSPLFTIKTPTALVTDLGTEFGVAVDDQGNTTSYVFCGIIEARRIAMDGKLGDAIRLFPKDAVRIEKDTAGRSGALQRIAGDPQQFVRVDQMPRLSNTTELEQESFRRWKTCSEKLRRDPSLLAYYDFQQRAKQPAVLANVAENGRSWFDGSVENATWTHGRMPGKHALLFNGPADYVRTNLSQTVDDLTLMAWVNVRSLGNPWSGGLLMSTEWNHPGQVHWQIRSNGAMRLDVCRWKTWYESMPVFNRGRFNCWTQLVLVVSRKERDTTVAFYMNGKLVNESRISESMPFQIGPAAIGHWYPGDGGSTTPRNLCGSIDEMAIFGRVISADEVRNMFEAGRNLMEANQANKTPSNDRSNGLEKR